MRLSYKTVLRKTTHFFGNYAYKRKIKKFPQKFFSLRELLASAGIETEELGVDVKEKLDTKVSYVCRWGDRFTENCICVQLYDDSDERMKLAMKAGALVCVTKKEIEGIPCIVVDNPEIVYSDMCSAIRDTAEVKTAVVVGSIGKTTTKKMVESVFCKGFNTLCDSGNDNILDSVGSICQHIPKKSEYYIAEISEDTPGLIEQMSKITKPDIAIITAIDKSHIKFYGSEENIFNEFRKVTKHMREDGVCIMSLDHPNAEQLITDKRVVYVSVKDKEADFYASDISVNTDGINFNVYEKSTGNVYYVKLINSFAEHNVTTALLAFAAGVEAGVSYDKIVEGLAAYRPSGIRQNIYKAGKTVVYADCYNAVAKSVKSAVNAACIIPIKGKRIAVLGDVAEAGDYTEHTHLEIAEIVNNSSFDIVMRFGKELKKALDVAKMRDSLTVYKFDTQKELNKKLRKIVKSGDLVLFKASHSGNLKKSISKTFPVAYLYQALRYYIPRVVWHFKVVLN